MQDKDQVAQFRGCFIVITKASICTTLTHITVAHEQEKDLRNFKKSSDAQNFVKYRPSQAVLL